MRSMDLNSDPFAVFILTIQVFPSPPGRNSTTLLSGHSNHFSLLFPTNTTSPIATGRPERFCDIILSCHRYSNLNLRRRSFNNVLVFDVETADQLKHSQALDHLYVHEETSLE